MSKIGIATESKTVDKVCAILDQWYKSPRLGNPQDPLDDLIFITLSNKTTSKQAAELYSKLKERYKNWDALCNEQIGILVEILKPGGFALIKSQFILKTLKKLRTEQGCCDLKFLRDMNEEEVFAYLITLPGVSNKVAKCVMLYTLGFEVLPVDSHVFRVAKRLGWTDKNRADLSHDQLEQLIPAYRRYSFHVNALAHGRVFCRPRQPLCSKCPITKYCKF